MNEVKKEIEEVSKSIKTEISKFTKAIVKHKKKIAFVAIFYLVYKWLVSEGSEE